MTWYLVIYTTVTCATIDCGIVQGYIPPKPTEVARVLTPSLEDCRSLRARNPHTECEAKDLGDH